jgi:hypothetical protein
LKHILSPKLVTNTSGGYDVKVDLVNIDNVSATGAVTGGGGGSTSTLFMIKSPSQFNSSNFTIPDTNDLKITGVDTVNFKTDTIVGSGGSIRIDVANKNLIKVTCFLTFDGRVAGGGQIPGGYNRGYLYWKSNDNVRSSLSLVDIQDWQTSISADFRYPVSFTWTLQEGLDFTSVSQYVELWGFASDDSTLQFAFEYNSTIGMVNRTAQRILVEYLD